MWSEAACVYVGFLEFLHISFFSLASSHIFTSMQVVSGSDSNDNSNTILKSGEPEIYLLRPTKTDVHFNCSKW